MNLHKLKKIMAKLEREFERTPEAQKRVRARIMKKANKIQKLIDRIEND